jgi:hypothetical protein
MAGTRGRSGGARPGAGGPKGRRGALALKTRDERALYARCIAAIARDFKKRGVWPSAPDLPSDPDRTATIFTSSVLAILAIKGDSRAAIHLDERLHGRVKFQLEHAGDVGVGAAESKGPIEFLIRSQAPILPVE